jgi:2,5-diketo-D-gluconate reductase B
MPPASLPRIGLGTVSDDPDEWTDAVRTALEMGYRHVDTAQMYENETQVGAGIEDADVDREEVFLASKTVYPDAPDDPHGVSDAIDESRERLGVDTVDLFYVHWPSEVYEPEIVLPQYEQAVRDGRIDHVGVANFTPELFAEAQDLLDVPILAHQAELHPLLQQTDLVEHAQRADIWLVAYCPVARGKVFDVPEIVAVAEKHGVTPAQVSLAWLLSMDNVAVIPKSSDPAHMRENLAAADVDLDEEDLARIESIDREHRIIDMDAGPWNR